jgi:hypothetical protein
MNEEEKKAIEFLKETNFDYLEYDMCVNSVEIISNLVKRLQKENEELKNQKATQRKINELLVQRYSNSISVQQVKDKIKILEKLQNEFLNNEELRVKIIAYKELIEEREEK